MSKPTVPSMPRPPSKIVDADGRLLDAATLAYLFQPMSPELFDDPVCGAELRRLAQEDPDVIAAVGDVDRTLIRDDLRATPDERLRVAQENLNALAKYRRAG
jgi:hypothetical protein